MRALLLLLLALPARAELDAAFRKRFFQESVAALSELDATREHLAFVKAHGIDLQISTSTAVVPAANMGVYRDSDKVMYFNEGHLLNGLAELENAGVKRDDAARILAWKFLPTLAHEIRHAITHEAIRRKLGFSFDTSSLEDEMVSFVDTVRVLQDAIRAKPDYWLSPLFLKIDGSDSACLAAWRKNPLALKELVAPLYPDAPSVLDLSRAEFLACLDARVKDFREKRELFVKAQAEVAAVKDPAERARLQKILDDSGNDAVSRDNLERGERLRRVMADPANYAKIKAYFKDAIRTLVRKTSAQTR